MSTLRCYVDFFAELVVVGGLDRLALTFGRDGAFEREIFFFKDTCVPAIARKARFDAKQNNKSA